MTDPFDLQRFLDAQSSVYPLVLDELRRGRMQSHWMWFIFPQLAGLGHRAMAQRFVIASRAEAVAYLGHGVLGSRLRESTALVNGVDGRTILEIFGSPDDLKFHSDDLVRCGDFRSEIRGGDYEVLTREAGPDTLDWRILAR
jgi:uncharacterized protein (DUF1810 family)